MRPLLVLLAALAVAAPAGAGTTASLSWAGWDDRVGPFWQATPDGYRDGHFRVTVEAAAKTLTSVVLNPLKPDGSLASLHEWNTTPKDGRWIVGIERGGVRLNATDVPVCDAVGFATYDLFAEDDGAMNAKATFRVTLTFADGETVTAETTLGDVSTTMPRLPNSSTTPATPAPDAVGACASSGLGVQSTPGPPTTRTPTPPATSKPPAKKAKPLPLCKKGQKSTAKKPCRKPTR